MTKTAQEAMKSEFVSALAKARTATLSVNIKETGTPYGALVNFATDRNGHPVLLLSTLAKHTQALVADDRASLLVMGDGPLHGDALTGFRASIMGTLARTEDRDALARYLARHPYAQSYAEFGDFSFWKLSPMIVHSVAGFGRIVTWIASDVFPVKIE